MKTSALINVSYCDTYLITFLYSGTSSAFIVTIDKIADCIKLYGERGIKSIKRFNPCTCKFERIKKSVIITLISWDTESYLYLKNHYYFK